MQVRSLGQEDPLEEGKASHSSALKNFFNHWFQVYPWIP